MKRAAPGRYDDSTNIIDMYMYEYYEMHLIDVDVNRL